MTRQHSLKGTVFRVVVGFITPPVFAAFVITFYDKVLSSGLQAKGNFWELWFALTVFAFIFAGIQSLVCSLVMEFWFNRRINEHIPVIFSGILLGALSGVLIYSAMMTYLGAFVGGITSLLLRWLYINRKDKQEGRG